MRPALPPVIAARLSREINAVLKSPEARTQLEGQGWEAVGGDAAAMKQRIAADTKLCGGVIAMAGLATGAAAARRRGDRVMGRRTFTSGAAASLVSCAAASARMWLRYQASAWEGRMQRDSQESMNPTPTGSADSPVLPGRRVVVGAAAAAWLLARLPAQAQAQPAGKGVRIGWLGTTPLALHPFGGAFTAGMRELGWVEGRDFTIDNLYSEGHNERLPALAAELVRRNVDLIISSGSPATTAAKGATSTIPIVFLNVADPVASGYVATLARPGGNLTGLGGLGTGIAVKELELLREMVPKASHIALMFHPTLSLHAQLRPELEPAARSLGVTLRPIELRSPDDIEAAFAAVARDRIDALLIVGEPFLSAHAGRIARLALEQRLAAIVPFGELAQAGVLMAYGVKLDDVARRVPFYVDRILKGAKPADLPVEQPTRFYLTINLKTAKAIGLTVPQSMLLRADEVIE